MHMTYGKKTLKVIACRTCYKFDCNAVMKGRNLDEAVDATIKHGVSMHGLDVKKLQGAESRAELGATSTDLEV